VIAASPREPLATKVLGMSLARQGRFAMAESYLRLAKSLGTNDAETEQTLQHVIDAQGQAKSSQYYLSYFIERSRYKDSPRNISIETVGRCNAKCDFFPNPVLDRRQTVMSDALFQKVIDDLSQIPHSHPLNIFPNLVNEPFMDRNFCDRIELLNSRLPRATLHIFTNFNVVHRDLFSRLQTLRNIRAFNVSLNAGNKAEYERVMAINFDRTVKNLRALMELNRHQRIFHGFERGVDFVAKVKNRTDW
jgi:hypothetical protein